VIHQLIAGIKIIYGLFSGATIEEYQKNAEFLEITSAGLKETMFMM